MKNIFRYMLVVAVVLAYGILTGCNEKETAISPSIQITDFFPTEGLSGTEVSIKGNNFGNNAKVFFNETEVKEYLSRSNDLIVVKVPDNASSGKIGVLNGDAYGFSSAEFSFVPSAVIEKLSTEKAPEGDLITIYGRNFFDVGIDKIIVRFGNAIASVISATSSEITVIIPNGAESGNITVQFGNIQTVTGPMFTVGVVVVVVPDYVFDLKKYETGGGSFSVGDDGMIGSTKKDAYLVYPFTVDVDGNYLITAQTATNQSYACYLNADIGTDKEQLAGKVPDANLSQVILKQGWSIMEDHTYGSFSLKAGKTYYLRLYFLAEGTSWVGNVGNVVLKYAEDQTNPGIDVDNGLDYNLYSNDFNSGVSLLPFSASWAWDPNYIKVENRYAEFYYNQAALDADNRRERRGCELTCGFSTTTDGWYGFKIFLPEGKFPKNVDGSIIAQIFNSGDANTWAGHLKINQNKLVVSYRGSAAASAEINKEVGTLTWDKWIPIVIYFKAGRNNKGLIRVWMGDNIVEVSPTFDSGPINFAFGNWIDDNTLNGTVTPDNPVADNLGGKWGLYVSSGGDRTIRYDDLKVLEKNPTEAFNIVKPGN
ncbi:MAG: IPT/TIG domain-containing protein [Prevotella sp.]|nr:IPT/TIG domain-containing protein [Prevotella sp.]